MSINMILDNAIRFITNTRNKIKNKHKITDVFRALKKKLDDPEIQMIRSGAVSCLSQFKPNLSIVFGIGNDFLSKYNDMKLRCLISALSTEKNIELRINELYNYVVFSETRALNVANLFKQAINAQCPSACVILGLILANHLDDDSDLTYDELVVCKAVENATDYDLKNFKKIMNNYLKPESNGARVVFPKNSSDVDRYTTTCDWCVYNRIFITRMLEWQDMTEGTLDISTYYYVAKPANILLAYIDELSQVMYYGDNKKN